MTQTSKRHRSKSRERNRDNDTERKHKCNNDCKCACPNISLTLVDEIKYSNAHATTSTFSLGSCFKNQPIKLTVTVCVHESWKPVTFKKCLHTDCKGEFSVEFPKNTTEVKLVVKVNHSSESTCDNGCFRLEYVNAPCGSTPLSYLSGDDLQLFSLLRHCTNLCINTSGVDHKYAKQQLGPCRASRAMAMSIGATFEAVNAIKRQYTSYIQLPRGDRNASAEAAGLRAAHDVLVELFSAQTEALDDKLREALALIPSSASKTAGINIGKQAARLMIELRQADGSQHAEQRIGNGPDDFHVNPAPGYWSMDPISQVPIALGSLWSQVKPFVIDQADQFRCPAPPALDSHEYAMGYNETASLGGDGLPGGTPTIRSEEQTFIGTYWAFDGVPALCGPPRMYNQIALQLCTQMKLDAMQTGRVCALLNLAMADSGIAAWESKYYYQLWRPVTAMRRAAEDNNPETYPVANFSPLGAPASNSTGPNFTPPFPSAPSGHSCFGATLFQILRREFGRDDIPFTFVSEEYDGHTKDNQGNTRPLRPRAFNSLSQAEEENGQSRMYLGIHWNCDKTSGIKMGRDIGDWVYDRVFQPV